MRLGETSAEGPPVTPLDALVDYERTFSHRTALDEVELRALRDEAGSEFELLQGAQVSGHKLYARTLFFPLDDPRARSPIDFRFRLSTLFGFVDTGHAEDEREPEEGEGWEWVLRHRATNIVVYAYSAQSGPSYGGAQRIVRVDGSAPAADENVAGTAFRYETIGEHLVERQRRVFSDSTFSTPPVNWEEHVGVSVEAARELRRLETAHARRLSDALAPDGVPDVVERLEELLMRVEIAPAS